MQLPSLSNVSNEDLLARISLLRGTENQAIADVILHLHEINSRGIFRDAGYSSLFKYCREGLGYSEGSAWRRVQAASCLAKSPEIYELIRSGKLNLCALAEVSKVMTDENTAEVIQKTEGASKREAQSVATQFGAPEKSKREVIRAKKVVLPPVKSNIKEAAPEPVEERYSFSFEVRPEVRELYEKAKELMGPCGIADVFEKALREYVGRRTKTSRKPVKSTSPVEEVAKQTRDIPNVVRRTVVERDGGQCTFVSSDGKRCSERCGLQFDHVRPFAIGGGRYEENIRLLCPAHNQLCAERVFGREFMVGRRGRRVGVPRRV